MISWCQPRVVLAAALLFLLGACATVPFTGRRQLLLLDEPTEVRMGLQAYHQVLADERLSTDPRVNAMVTQVGQRIAAATERPDLPWEFQVVDNPKMVNAFCLPGGKIVVYTGILPITRDEAGLAAVIGHEVAHAIARHGGERVSQELLTDFGLAVVVEAMDDSGTTLLVAGVLGAGATVGILLPYSREHESEADRLGLIYMAKAGYDPRGARDFWTRMAQASSGTSSLPEFLSTHPVDETRIQQIDTWLPEALAFYTPGKQ